MTAELDAGPIYAQGTVPVGEHDELGSEGQEGFARLSERLIGEALARVERGAAGDLQDERQASYAGLFEPAYVEVD